MADLDTGTARVGERCGVGRRIVPRFVGIHRFGFADAAAWRTSVVKRKKKRKKDRKKEKRNI